MALVRHLRDRCPWDGGQTAESLVPHLLEEAAEVADAVFEGSDARLAEELGDLLLNLAFQIVVGQEAGRFSADGILRLLEAKMVRRHPHVYGEGGARGRDDGSRQGSESRLDRAARAWEEVKAAESAGERSVLAGLPKRLDPLTKAYRMQQKVASVGFDWENPRGGFDKLEEELSELKEAARGAARDRLEAEAGDVLLAAVNLARLLGVHPTTALAKANLRFAERFRGVERLARERGVNVAAAGLELLDAYWEEVKVSRGGSSRDAPSYSASDDLGAKTGPAQGREGGGR